jgi:hypothetical protein
MVAVMNGCSHLIQKAVKAVNDDRIEFEDTRFPTSPMWDSASDWRHLPVQVSDAEALYMDSNIFGLDN